jgi:hypothetical protein
MLARLDRRLKATVENGELRFRAKHPDPIVENAVKSIMARIAELGGARIPAEDIAFYRFENFEGLLTDNPEQIRGEWEAKRIKRLRDAAQSREDRKRKLQALIDALP